ncbi:hypothetical protein ACIBEA_42600 [Streptomyces sp. NPDC051555]|uniref:hypothetical protein n=1 Tax=Streptomyces sp. NPDC051555 TaxID=3365657 RepID=UPI00378C318E
MNRTNTVVPLAAALGIAATAVVFVVPAVAATREIPADGTFVIAAEVPGAGTQCAARKVNALTLHFAPCNPRDTNQLWVRGRTDSAGYSMVMGVDRRCISPSFYTVLPAVSCQKIEKGTNTEGYWRQTDDGKVVNHGPTPSRLSYWGVRGSGSTASLSTNSSQGNARSVELIWVKVV